MHEDPWDLLPPDAVGRFVNGTLIDLRGARDKVMAQLAYERFNRAHRSSGLAVRIPRTILASRPEDTQAAWYHAIGRWVSRRSPAATRAAVLSFTRRKTPRHRLARTLW